MTQETLTTEATSLTNITEVNELQTERLRQIGHQAANYLSKSKADNTRKAYASDWDDFLHWCKRFHRNPLPALPETVAFYLADCSDRLKTSTLQRRLATIAEAHKTAGHESPTRHAQVRLVWAGVRREKGMAQLHRKPLLTRHLKAMLEALPDSLVGLRDHALLLLGFSGAMRRSELVGLDVGDLSVGDEGLVVLIRKSKTDPTGIGRKLGIPFGTNEETCPVKAVLAWLDTTKLDDGPLFRRVDRHGFIAERRLCSKAVADVVKRTLAAAGKSNRLYSGHSLRAGLITQAAMNGVSERSIADQSGHKSLIVLRRYIRDGSLFRENAAGKVGL
jgi:integrase